MKMAELFQSGLRMTAFTTRVTQVWPRLTSAGGCSLLAPLGITHETDGSAPRRAASKNRSEFSTFRICRSMCTVVNRGSGFQISGVPGSGGLSGVT
jgi:hypothetical protein